MRNTGHKGLTLIELVISISIMMIIAATAIPLLSTSLDVYSHGSGKSHLYQEGLHAMERITTSIRKSTFLNIPNAHNPTRNVLALSGIFDTDGDYYFGNSLFPSINEDLPADMNGDNKNGLAGIDDDGDGSVDEGGGDEDDDEDGQVNEDWLDGIDNDGDGNIDEDCGGDMNNDGAAGIKGVDDDADGWLDMSSSGDDDEDGSSSTTTGLIQMIYWVPSGTTLREDNHYSGENRELSTHVTKFEVTFNSPGMILINLELTSDEGEKIEFTEYAYARNTYQRMGKKVR